MDYLKNDLARLNQAQIDEVVELSVVKILPFDFLLKI